MKGKDEIISLIDSFIEESTTVILVNNEVSTEDNDLNAQNCTNEFYTFIHSVEMELKDIPSKKSFDSDLGLPQITSDTLKSRGSVIDSWNNLMTESAPDSATEDLQSKVLQLYIKIRSFAFTSKKVEHHKQSKKEISHSEKEKPTDKIKCRTVISMDNIFKMNSPC